MNLKTIALIAVVVWAPLLDDAFADTKTGPHHDGGLLRSAKCLTKSEILAKLRQEGYRPTKHRTSSGRMLFFDEADALFGKRTGVRDSHDRYAGRDTRRTMKRSPSHSGKYLVTAVRHNRPVKLTVDKCTGKVIDVALAEKMAKALQCLSKSAVYQKLKTSYSYLKQEKISGPYSSPQGKVYRAQTLVKEGPYWCQVKLTVSCYNAKVLEYDRLEDTCIY